MARRSRNFSGIQFEELRREIDDRYNEVHDELSDAYYGGKPFREYGVLSKETFDKLHALIFWMRDVEFDERNQTKHLDKRVPMEKYDLNPDGRRKSEIAKAKIEQLAAEGIKLII